MRCDLRTWPGTNKDASVASVSRVKTLTRVRIKLRACDIVHLVTALC